jgi:hypothetical protein
MQHSCPEGHHAGKNAVIEQRRHWRYLAVFRVQDKRVANFSKDFDDKEVPRSRVV